MERNVKLVIDSKAGLDILDVSIEDRRLRIEDEICVSIDDY